jgi:hypothetical protein
MSLSRLYRDHLGVTEAVVKWLCIRRGEVATTEGITTIVTTIPGLREVPEADTRMILGRKSIALAGDAVVAEEEAEAGIIAGTTIDNWHFQLRGPFNDTLSFLSGDTVPETSTVVLLVIGRHQMFIFCIIWSRQSYSYNHLGNCSAIEGVTCREFSR